MSDEFGSQHGTMPVGEEFARRLQAEAIAADGGGPAPMPVPNFAEGLPTPEQLMEARYPGERQPRDPNLPEAVDEGEFDVSIEGSVFETTRSPSMLAGTVFEPPWQPAVNADFDDALTKMLSDDAEQAEHRRRAQAMERLGADDELVERLFKRGNPQAAHYVVAPGSGVAPSGTASSQIGPIGQAPLSQQIAEVGAGLVSIGTKLTELMALIAQMIQEMPSAAEERMVYESTDSDAIARAIAGPLAAAIDQGLTVEQAAAYLAMVPPPPMFVDALLRDPEALWERIVEVAPGSSASSIEAHDFLLALVDHRGVNGSWVSMESDVEFFETTDRTETE